MPMDDAVKDFPLGFVMAIPIFRIHPATWHCFGVFLYFVLSEEYRDIWIIRPGDVPSHGNRPLFRWAFQSLYKTD